MIELEPHEIDMVSGGDHWGYEARQDPVALARSYMYANGGFWGPSYPSCTASVQVQTRSETTTGGNGFGVSLTSSFPFIGISFTPKETTKHTATVERTVTCTY